MNIKPIALETLAKGSLGELFAAEVAKVIANIADINTDPKQSRKITIDLVFKPGADRGSADVKINCNSKLAGLMTVNTQLFMGLHNGKLVAVENDLRQGNFFDSQQPKPLAAVSAFPATQTTPKDGE